MTVGELIEELQKDVQSGKYKLDDPVCYTVDSKHIKLQEIISIVSTKEYIQILEPGRELSVYKYSPELQTKTVVRIV